MSIEVRSLELWRAVAVECLATFFFGLVVAGAAAASAVSGSGLSVLATAVASGFAIAAISLIFSHISGKNVSDFFLLLLLDPRQRFFFFFYLIRELVDVCAAEHNSRIRYGEIKGRPFHSSSASEQ